jgi:CubicO group peptidase (beta-lactamase class C family)
MSDPEPVGSAMRAAVAKGVFPGAVLLARVQGVVRYHAATGDASLVPVREPTSTDTLYDLASLTKPLATVTALLLLVQEGRVALEDAVQRHLPELAETPVGSATVCHLLNHSSGLPGWRPLYERIVRPVKDQPGGAAVPLEKAEAQRLALRLIGHEQLVYPRGARSLYSDLGFMLLGVLIERVSGLALHDFFNTRICDPLRASPLGFRPLPLRDSGASAGSSSHGIAATERDPWRARLLRGEVHDENAFALGGVAGHAGLFGTAVAVSVVTGEWLHAWQGKGKMLDHALARQFTRRQDGIPGSSWGLGWDTPSPPSSSGSRFSVRSFGHLGYTGTSIWIDPEAALEVILLSNRVHPSRSNTAIQQFRPVIHDLIYEQFVVNRR